MGCGNTKEINDQSNIDMPKHNKSLKTQDKLTAEEAKVFLVTCMDFRLLDDVNETMRSFGYDKNYDQFIIAGASLGFTQDKYAHWGKTVLDHLEIGKSIHHLRKIVFIDHLDCGAYKKFYPEMRSKEEEYVLHENNLQITHDILKAKFPNFDFKGYVMDMNGKVKDIIIDTHKVHYNALIDDKEKDKNEFLSGMSHH